MQTLSILRHTFKKEERLHSKLLIGRLFANGKSFFIHPFKITFLEIKKSKGPSAQVMISVSKRNITSAIRRNRIKRLIRETYRKNKFIICDNYKDKPDTQLIIGLVYVAKTIETYSEIERKLILILHRLIDKDEGSNR